MCEAGHRWPEFNLKGELAWHQAVVLIGKFMTYPLLFYLPVARLWHRGTKESIPRKVLDRVGGYPRLVCGVIRTDL